MKTPTPEKPAKAPRLLPHLEGKTCACPYCKGKFTWPPANMACPACGRVIRPPVGYAPPGKAARREAVEAIRRNAERRRREQGEAPVFAGGRRPAILLAAVLVFVVLGGALVSTSYRRSATSTRRQRDPLALTQQEIAVYATALAHFKADTGRYPRYEEGGLLALVSDPGVTDWHGPYVNTIHNDGWRRPFFFDQTNDVPILVSAGPDKTYKTADDLVAPPEAFRPHPDFIRHDPSRRDRGHTSAVKIGAEP